MLKKIKYYTLTNPTLIFKDVITSLNLFINKLFPAMFFFYTLSDLLINYGFINILELLFNKLFLKLFHISGVSSFIVIMSLISGFPSGSKYITSFLEKGFITYDEANYLLTFTHFSNPLFILGTISIIFNKKLAIYVLISHYLSNFILAFIIRPKEISIEKVSPKPKKESLSTTLSNSFQSSFKILLLVLFNTCFFYTLSDIVTIYINNNLIKSIVYGIFDLTKGIVSLKKLNITFFMKCLLVTSFLSFGGLSVNFQVKEIISKFNLKYHYFMLGRISSLAIAVILLIVLIKQNYFFYNIHILMEPLLLCDNLHLFDLMK